MNTSGTRGRSLLLAGYFVAQMLFVLLASDAFLLRVDDSYYYFGIAWHVVDSGRFSFDGLHLTNGFQPLWQFVLVGVTALCRLVHVTDKDTLVRVYFVVCALLNTLSAWLAMIAADRMLGRNTRASQLAIFLCLWFPGITTSLLAGMENSVNWPLLLAFFGLLTDEEGRIGLAAIPRRRFTALIAVSVLLVYARLDNSVILATTVLFLWARERSSASIRKGLVWGVIVVVCWVPLLLWGKVVFGSPTPISGSAKLFNTGDFIAGHGLVRYLAVVGEGFFLSILALPASALGMGYYELLKPIVMKLGFSLVIGLLGLGLGVAAVALTVALRRLRPPPRPPMPAALPLLATLSVVHLLTLVVLFPDQWMYAGIIWYDLVEYLTLFVLIGWLGGWLTHALSDDSWRRLVRVGQVAFVLSLVPMLLWRPALPTEGQIKRTAALWINQNLPPEAIVASHDAGALGFFARVPVINLDGLVNDKDFLDHYLRTNRKRQYLTDAKVTHLADIDCPRTPTERFRRMLHLPQDGKIVLKMLGNEHDLTFCIVELGH